MSCAKARIPPSGLLISCATPPASCPTADIFSAWKRRRETSRSSVTSLNTTTTAPASSLVEREGADEPGALRRSAVSRSAPGRGHEAARRARQRAVRVVGAAERRRACSARRRRRARTRCWRGPPRSRPSRMIASGSPIASKQARHSCAARTSACERAASLPSRSRFSRSSSALRSRDERLEPRVLLDDPELVDGALDRDEEVAVVPGLPDEAEDLGAVHRLLDRARVRLPGEEDALDPRPALLHDAQELDAGHPRHPVVGDDDLDRLALEDAPARRPRPARRGRGSASGAGRASAHAGRCRRRRRRAASSRRQRSGGCGPGRRSPGPPPWVSTGKCTARSRSARTRVA